MTDTTTPRTTSTPPEVMDDVLRRHFEAEAAHDIPGILSTLTEDCRHDVVGWPTGVSHGHDELVPFYERLFTDFAADNVTQLQRYYGDDFVVDEVEYSGTAIGEPFGLPGNGRPVSFRMLHVCEFRDGKISRENVWLDFPAIMQQLAPQG